MYEDFSLTNHANAKIESCGPRRAGLISELKKYAPYLGGAASTYRSGQILGPNVWLEYALRLLINIQMTFEF